jgi:hypothetical protein
MTDTGQLRRALISRVLGSRGRVPATLRRAAFDADLTGAGCGEPVSKLVEKVAYRSDQVTDEDVAAVRTAGLSEDGIFEIVVCAAVGQANRQYHSGLTALAGATGEQGTSDEA